MSVFSENNTPYFETPYLIEVDQDEPPSPPPMKRTTNHWMIYFGNYPNFCASIIECEEDIDRMFETNRHVCKLLVGSNFPKREVMHHIERIVTQLSCISGITYTKKTARIMVIMGDEEFTLNFFVCDDSGLFHVLLEKPLILDEKFVAQDLYTPNINRLILCIRTLLQDNDVVNVLPEVSRDTWFRHALMTKRPQAEIEYMFPE
jgi:hypothetical protein